MIFLLLQIAAYVAVLLVAILLGFLGLPWVLVAFEKVAPLYDRYCAWVGWKP